jgi:hypothetical protein
VTLTQRFQETLKIDRFDGGDRTFLWRIGSIRAVLRTGPAPPDAREAVEFPPSPCFATAWEEAGTGTC